jgi:hypothetical protein
MQRLKALFGVFLVVAFFYLAWKILPPYIQEYQFQQEIQSIARNSEYAPLDENGIRKQVAQKITDFGIPVNPESVVINKASFDVSIGVNYTVHIDSAIHPFDIQFHPSTKNGDAADPVPANRTTQ